MPKLISIKLQSNFIEITLQHGCSPVNLLHIFRKFFLKNTSEVLLLISDGAKFKNFNLLFIARTERMEKIPNQVENCFYLKITRLTNSYKSKQGKI